MSPLLTVAEDRAWRGASGRTAGGQGLWRPRAKRAAGVTARDTPWGTASGRCQGPAWPRGLLRGSLALRGVGDTFQLLRHDRRAWGVAPEAGALWGGPW